MQQRRRPKPTVALPFLGGAEPLAPASAVRNLAGSWGRGWRQKSGPHGDHCNTGDARTNEGPNGGPGRTWQIAGWSRLVRGLPAWNGRWNPAERGPPPDLRMRSGEPGEGASMEDAVSLHGWVAGGASHSRWVVALFPSWRPLFLQVIHIPGKSASLLCSDSANCADS